jgi:hypothetical protein
VQEKHDYLILVCFNARVGCGPQTGKMLDSLLTDLENSLRHAGFDAGYRSHRYSRKADDQGQTIRAT